MSSPASTAEAMAPKLFRLSFASRTVANHLCQAGSGVIYVLVAVRTEQVELRRMQSLRDVTLKDFAPEMTFI
jgi:hypothetical protein